VCQTFFNASKQINRNHGQLKKFIKSSFNHPKTF